MSDRQEAYQLYGAFMRRLADFSKGECDVESVRHSLSTINNFFYQKPSEAKTFDRDGVTHEFFSKYHVFWRECHEEIIEPKVNDESCRTVAGILHGLRGGARGRDLFYTTVDTKGLAPKELAQVRFFTAPHDFRGSINNERTFDTYRDDPERFTPEAILSDVNAFLLTIMSKEEANEQRDAREKFALTCARVLQEQKCSAYELAGKFGYSAARLRRFLSEENEGTGYGIKKADMFLRDMLVWKVWPLKDVECIDVASDANTIRVALRTRILTTAIPLLSSFLDVFCYQYGLIDQWNARAWRRVWELWREENPKTCPECPALLDYLIYRIIGREFCRDGGLTVLQCDRNQDHVVYWQNARKKLCPYSHAGKSGNLRVSSRHLPCTHDKGKVAIQKSPYVTGDQALLPGISECPFVPVCRPRDKDFRRRIAPDSISIYRATGWRSAYTTEEQGGGGLSS